MDHAPPCHQLKNHFWLNNIGPTRRAIVITFAHISITGTCDIISISMKDGQSLSFIHGHDHVPVQTLPMSKFISNFMLQLTLSELDFSLQFLYIQITSIKIIKLTT